jgi:hypothetical protein
MARPRLRQLTIFPRGGRRPGAGRKPKGPRPMVSHARKPRIERELPVLVTVRMRQGLPSLRAAAPFHALVAAFTEGPGFRLVHFSVQSSHVHLTCEARDEAALSRGMHSLLLRVRHALRRVWSTSGRHLADRFHARALRTPREVRNALVYVLHNRRKHASVAVALDPCSSAVWFDGWLEPPSPRPGRSPLAPPRTWLLRAAWRRHGRIGLDERPGKARNARRRRPWLWRGTALPRTPRAPARPRPRADAVRALPAPSPPGYPA